MSYRFINGAIVKTDKFNKATFYDVSNSLITAQFDGRGNISRYAVMNKWDIIENYYSMITINGHSLDYYADKEVTMTGRVQTVKTTVNNSEVTIRQFIDNNTNAIFTQYEVIANEDIDIKIAFNMSVNFTSYLKNFFSSRLSLRTITRLLNGYIINKSKKNKGILREDNVTVIKNNITGDFYFDVAINEGGEALEKESLYHNQYAITKTIKAGDRADICYVISSGTRGDDSYADVRECISNFNAHYLEALDYIEQLPEPKGVSDEYLRAYYKNLINCSLSMYKESGDFKGFMAGINYQAPLRTYYRDGYWTILSVLPVRPDLVRNEIITLSRGIDKDGKCPSAVKHNFKNWWGDHYDSPSFFAIMLYDYVKHTGDLSIINERWRKGTILDAAISVIERLSLMADCTGLLVKAGKYNRRDWADNVFRTGYVTYDEILFARALFCLSKLTKTNGNLELSKSYYDRYIKVRDSINELLWDEDKGYYINYKNGDYIEDNLSIDTVTAVLFSIADEDRAKRLLKNMENILETKNNSEQSAGDYGVMCVYPFYKRNEDVVGKSSLPYYYHNGADWPYLSGIYAYAKLMYKMKYIYPLTRWYDYNLDKGNYTPIEFYSPPHVDGSLLQGWSSTGAFVLSYPEGNFFR